MAVTKLPSGAHSPSTGWIFQGPWAEADQQLITQTLNERVLHRTQAQADPWLFIAHPSGYYAHTPTAHAPGHGYREDTAAELADGLWGHYFTLRLGPLVLAATLPAPSPSPVSHPTPETPSSDDLRESLVCEWQALEHFQNALAHIRHAEYAAAKRELQLSFGLCPANSFYNYRRVETLGDVESYLGDDVAAERHYAQALELATSYRESWADTELRLKLAWCALRRAKIGQARSLIDAALRVCEHGREADGGSRSLNYVHGLALATLADLHLHALDLNAALTAAHQAAAIASRLGQSYGEKARLYAYLAWQLYRHGETTAARSLATRAWTALDRWVPVASAQTEAMRSTLTTILDGTPQPPSSSKMAALPPRRQLIADALAAVWRMQSWVEQTAALHDLAPHLAPGQLHMPLHDLLVWDDTDRRFFAPYRTLLEADLALAISGAARVPGRHIRALVAIDATRFAMHVHEHLYAETLMRLRDRVALEDHALLAQRIDVCASEWGQQLATVDDDYVCGRIEGLLVLAPQLQAHVQQAVVAQIEARLLAQLAGQRFASAVFLAALPALARLGAGTSVFEAVVQAQPRSSRMWIACLAHATTLAREELRTWIVETVFHALKESAPYGSTTVIAELIHHMAPYLQGDEVDAALALITPVRAIVPRVRALVALADVLAPEPRQAVLATAWQAAQRSTKADAAGTALATIAARVASST